MATSTLIRPASTEQQIRTSQFDTDNTVEFFKDTFFNREDRLGVYMNSRVLSVDTSSNSINDFIESHLFGNFVDSSSKNPVRIGAYTPGIDNHTKWLCYDLDGGNTHSNPLINPKENLLSLVQRLKAEEVSPYIELSKSGNGFHLWIFFEEPVLANQARIFGFYFLPETVQLKDGTEISATKNKGVEVFPKTDQLPEGKYGNMVYLAYSGESGH